MRFGRYAQDYYPKIYPLCRLSKSEGKKVFADQVEGNEYNYISSFNCLCSYPRVAERLHNSFWEIRPGLFLHYLSVNEWYLLVEASSVQNG